MFAKILCFLVIVQAVTFAASSPFSPCAPGEPTPKTIELENCDGNRCIVRRKEHSRIVLNFVSPVEVTAATAKVQAQFKGTWFPWLIGKAGNVCNNLVNNKCPLAASSTAGYTINLRITGLAPADSEALVEIRLTNSNKQLITCTRINVLVK